MAKIKSLLAPFMIAAATALTGCSTYLQVRNDDVLGADMPDIKANAGPVFNGADSQTIMTVSGKTLEEGARYHFKGGLLIVEGNVPKDTKIIVTNGKLYVDGTVGAGAVLEANVPEKTRIEKINESGTRYVDGMSHEDIPGGHIIHFDGFKYPNDRDPAVIVTGHVHPGAVIRSNHGIHIRGFIDSSAKLKTWNNTKITTGEIPRLYIAPPVTPVPKGSSSITPTPAP